MVSSATRNPSLLELSTQLVKYISKINQDDAESESFRPIYKDEDFILLRSMFFKVLCVPATPASVECVFFQGGIIMRTHRARMSENTLKMLMFLRCNGQKAE